MLLLKAVDMPDTCYVQEVVYWLAFGRVPDWLPYEEHGNARQDADAILSGDYDPIDSYDNGFEAIEFRICGVDVDFDRYLNARVTSKTSSEYAEERDAFFQRYGSTEDSIDEQHKQDMLGLRSQYENDIVELKWAEASERHLMPFIDRARAIVFQALSVGELKAFGFVESSKFREETYDYNTPTEELGAFEDIPPHVWTMEFFKWRKSELGTPEKTFTHVQVRSADMLNVFPTPHCERILLPCEAFGGVVISRDESSEPPGAVRTKGRPQVGVSVKTALQNWLRQKLKMPEFATLKRESQIAEGMAFAKDYLGHQISRSSVQSYLTPVWLELGTPEYPPENGGLVSPEMHAAE